MQSSGSGSSDGTGAALAATSQAMPLHAAAAVAGDSNGFAGLADDVQRLANLRGSASSLGLPGGASAWDELNSHAQAILAKRNDIEGIVSAATFVNEHMPVMLEASDQLMNRSGSTAVIQEFQNRGAAVQNSLAMLATNVATVDAQTTAAAIATDMVYLRMVTDALGGADTNLDVAALNAATRDVALVAIISKFINMET